MPAYYSVSFQYERAAIRLMRRSKSRQVRALSSHSTARLSGHAAALRAMRIGIETNSGNSSSVGCGTRAVFCAGGSSPSTSPVSPDALERSWRIAAVGRV